MVCVCVQAWGCMEAELGNLSQARGLFKAAVSLAPEEDAAWEAWIKMEEDNDLLSRANALRSHRFEVAERDALPPSFSTLPAEGGAVIGTVRHAAAPGTASPPDTLAGADVGAGFACPRRCLCQFE